MRRVLVRTRIEVDVRSISAIGDGSSCPYPKRNLDASCLARPRRRAGPRFAARGRSLPFPNLPGPRRSGTTRSTLHVPTPSHGPEPHAGCPSDQRSAYRTNDQGASGNGFGRPA